MGAARGWSEGCSEKLNRVFCVEHASFVTGRKKPCAVPAVNRRPQGTFEHRIERMNLEVLIPKDRSQHLRDLLPLSSSHHSLQPRRFSRSISNLLPSSEYSHSFDSLRNKSAL